MKQSTNKFVRLGIETREPIEIKSNITEKDCGTNLNPPQNTSDKGYTGECPIHKQDYRKCDECIPQDTSDWIKEFESFMEAHDYWSGGFDKAVIPSIENYIRQLRSEWIAEGKMIGMNYKQDYADKAYKQGYDEGYEKGFEEGRDSIIKSLLEKIEKIDISGGGNGRRIKEQIISLIKG